MSDRNKMADTSVPQKNKGGRPKKSKTVEKRKDLTKPESTKTRQSVPKAFFSNHASWTHKQRNHLLKLLKLCPSENNIQEVYQNVPNHTPEQVEEEVNRLRNAAKYSGPQLQAPIETWLDFCEEMINYEEEDHSKCLGRTMSIVANYERFEKKKDGPDYSNLYKYIAAILNQVEPPKLSPLESLVMVDLMHSLVDVLSETDTSTQRAVMKWKFSLLNCKVNINNLKETEAQTRRALANIFPDNLIKDRPRPGQSQVRQPSSTVGNRNDEDLSEEETPSTSALGSRTAGETTPDQDDGEISTTSEQNGKFCKQKDSRSASRSRAPGETTPDQDGGKCSKISEQKDSTEDDHCEGEPPLKKVCVRGQGRGRGRSSSQEEVPLVKPLLYTLNPFCVPVDILKLPKGKKKRKPKHTLKYL